MLAKIWENEVNRIDNVIGSFNFLFFVFLVYAKVSMHKIYGSFSVPAKVIKILDLTWEFNEVVSNANDLGGETCKVSEPLNSC